MVSRLKECTDQAEAIRTQLDSQCNTDERRELLGLEYRVCLLELDKVELEQSSLLRIHEAEAQRVEIRKLKLALRARDRLLLVQSDLIKKHGLSVDVLTTDGGMINGPKAGLAAVDAELLSYETFGESADEKDDGIEDDRNVWVDNKSSDVNVRVEDVYESKRGTSDGKRGEEEDVDDDDDDDNEDDVRADKVYSSQRNTSLESPKIRGDVSFVESTAEWMGARFSEQSQSLSSLSPKNSSNIQSQPRSPANPPLAPTSHVISHLASNSGHPKSQIVQTNQHQTNQQHLASVSSPPKAASWLERAVQLVRGVKSQKHNSLQQEIKQVKTREGRVFHDSITASQNENLQGPLRPLRLKSLSHSNGSEHLLIAQGSSDSLPGPQIPIRDPFDHKIVSQAGPATTSALLAAGKIKGNGGGLQKPRVYNSDTSLVRHASSDEMNQITSDRSFPPPSSYLPISTTEIRAALVLAEAKTVSAEASAAASVAALQRRDFLVKRVSNERLIPLKREEAMINEESKEKESRISDRRCNLEKSNQEEEDEEESGLLYAPRIEQFKSMLSVQSQRNDLDNQIASKLSLAPPSSRRSLSDGVTQNEERRLHQVPPLKKEPVWLNAIPPHRPPVSNALKMARAAEAREKKEALERASYFEAAPQVTNLNHAISAYSAPSALSRKAQILAAGTQRQPAAPRAIRDPDERALH